MDDCYLDEVPEKADSGLPFDISDLPPDIRLKIDDIVRNNEDFEAQIDAIDALLFGRRDPIDADNESGIDVESNSSNTASIASSSDYSVVVGGGCVSSGWPDPFRQTTITTAAVSFPLQFDDPVSQHEVLLELPPPPEFFQESNESNELDQCPPHGGFELPPPIEFTPSFGLPTLIELPEDDNRIELPCIPAPGYDGPGVGGDCIPPPFEFNSESTSVVVVVTSSSGVPAVANSFPKNSSSNSTNTLAAQSRASLSHQSRASSLPPIIAPKPLLTKHNSADSFPLKESAINSESVVITARAKSSERADQLTITSPVRVTQEQNRPTLSAVGGSNGLGPVGRSNGGGGGGAGLPVSVSVPAGTDFTGSSATVEVNGSLTNVPRRFQGITETQKKEIVVDQKKKPNFLQKWLRRGSSTSSTVDFVEDAANTTTADHAHNFSQTMSTKRNPIKLTESGISDFVSASATLPRFSAIGQTKAKPSSAANRMSQQFTKRDAGQGGENRLSFHESISTPSFHTPHSSPPLPTSSSVALDPPSRLEPDENAVINIEDVQWSSDEEDGTKNNSEESSAGGTTDEDEDEITILRKVKLRTQFRDESGRLTIGPSIASSRSRATSMMTLNEVGSRSTFSPSALSRTTDDIASRPVTNIIESGIMTLQRHNKKNNNNNNIFKQSAVPLGIGSSQRTFGKSPKSGRSTAIENSTLAHTGVVTDEDEELGLRRSDYLPSSSMSSTGPLATTSSAASMSSPAAFTDRLLRRSMLATSYDFSSSLETDTTSLLGSSPSPQTNSSFSKSVINDRKPTESQRDGNGAEENKFNTFRGAIKPMRWSEDRSEQVVMRRSGVNTISGFGGVSKSKHRMSVPPEWIIIKSPETSGVPEPPLTRHSASQETITTVTKPSIRPRPKTGEASQQWKNVENVEIPVPRFESRTQSTVFTRELETARPVETRQELLSVSSQQPLSDAQWRLDLPPDGDNIPPPPMEFLSGKDTADVEVPIPPPIFGQYSPVDLEPQSVYANLPSAEVMASESIAVKTYDNRVIHEAIIDTRSILIDLNHTKSLLLGNAPVDADLRPVSVTSRDQTLPTIVRQFVTDSKNFVAVTSAGTNGELSQSNAQLHPVTESAMRRLASMSVTCRRMTVASLTTRFPGDDRLVVPLPTIIAIVDYAIDVATVFGDMLDAARLVVDSRSDAGRRFAVDSLNGHAVSLARALVGFVQRTRTM